MKKNQRITNPLIGLIVLMFIMTACQPKLNENNNGNDPLVPTELSNPSGEDVENDGETNLDNPVPTSTSIFFPEPAPTARPLVEVDEGIEGQYFNNFYGLSLNYPTNWEILSESETDYELLLISNNNQPLYAYLTTYVLDEEYDLDSELLDYMEIMADNLSLPIDGKVEFEPQFQLNENLDVWMGVQETTVNNGTYVNKIYAYERGGRLFSLWIMGYDSNHRANASEIENILESFKFFIPTPYGVDRENAMFLSGGEPQTLDPAMHLGSADSYIGNLFSGLVRLDANLQLVPDLAERWEISPDGKVYTFYLRNNVRFHDGRPFTGDDVVYSWNRAADPDLHSPTVSTYLNDIVGVDEVINGSATEISGLKLIDDYTLEVTLDSPKAYFLYKMAYPTSWIVDSETVNEIDENPNGTGPFKLIKHEENEILIFARNENYHLGMVPLEYLVYLLYQGPNIRLYEAGLIDIIGINEDLLNRANDPSDPLFGNVQPNNNLCTSYVLLDMSMAPFEDINVRKAFAMAIDKERYNLVLSEGRSVIANGLFPPGLPGFDPTIVPMPYNPEAALEALGNSSYGSAENLPEIVFTTSGTGGGLHPSVALLIEMWEKELGVTIVVEQIDPQSALEQIMAGSHGQILSEGWCADYPDPENFADILFHTGNIMNMGHYSNLEIDALLEKARGETDLNTRMALYHQIEQMLVDNVAAIFLDHSSAYYLVTKAYIMGYEATPIGIAQTMNIWIER